jgi:5-methyltetrahydrofolate--homocysteine methyltransferase
MGEERFVLGDIGPFGGFLEPLGETTREELLDSFMAQVRGLAEGGADAIIIETMTSLEEIECAVEAARKACALPVIASLAFDKILGGGYRTMMGVAPVQAARAMEAMGVDVVACNCGTGIGILDHTEIVREFRSVTALPIMSQPNAGQPELLDDRIIYHETPQKMAANVSALVDAGATVVGGCCGTTPEHIRLFRAELDRRARA